MKTKLNHPKADSCCLLPFIPVPMKVWNPLRDKIDSLPSPIFTTGQGAPIFGTGMVVGYEFISIQFWGVN